LIETGYNRREDIMGLIESHAHLLPFVDDGVRTKEDCVRVLKAYAEAGFDRVVTTPHLYNPLVTTRVEHIRTMFAWAQQEAQKLGIAFSLGGETYVGGALDPLVLPFFQNCVLLEVDVTTEPLFLLHHAYALQKRGYTVILAHIERYHWFTVKGKITEQLREIGVYFQCNVEAVESHAAQRYLDQDMVDIIASDNHGDVSLPARMAAVLEEHPLIFQRMEHIFGLRT
jgi:protein-tyrosine phosphatase